MEFAFVFNELQFTTNTVNSNGFFTLWVMYEIEKLQIIQLFGIVL